MSFFTFGTHVLESEKGFSHNMISFFGIYELSSSTLNHRVHFQDLMVTSLKAFGPVTLLTHDSSSSTHGGQPLMKVDRVLANHSPLG